MIAYICITSDKNYPFSSGTFDHVGNFGYIVYGDSLENVIKITQERGYKIINLKEYIS